MAPKHSMPPRGTPSMFGDRYSDLVIICDKYQLPGHCVIVCNASDYFASKVNLAHAIQANGKSAIYIEDGTDAATVLRLVYWLYNKPADTDDNKLDLRTAEFKGPSSLGPYCISEPRFTDPTIGRYKGAQADLMELQEPHISSNALAVLTNELQKLNISSPTFSDETTSEMWVWLRLHRAAMSFAIPALAEECVDNMSNICSGFAYAADFVKFIQLLHKAVHLDVVQDGPAHVVANECAMNIEYLLDEGEFTNFLRERDGFSYLIIRKLKERCETAVATATGDRPRLLLTSAEDGLGESALSGLGDDTAKYEHRDSQLSAELDAAKVDVATKQQQIVDVQNRLEKTQQDLANAYDKMAHLRASTPAPVIRRDDEKRKETKKITDLQGKVATLSKELNQARLGRDEFLTNMMKANKSLEKENKRLQTKAEQAIAAARSSSLASAASAERVDKLEKTLSMRDAHDAATVLDMSEANNLQSNVDRFKAHITSLESEVAGLKSELSSKDIKPAQLSTVQLCPTIQPPPTIDPSRVSSEFAVRSVSPTPSVTTAGSTDGVVLGSHGGVMTFAEKHLMQRVKRQMAAGIIPQPSNVVPSSSQMNGAHPPQPNDAVPSQSNGIAATMASGKNGSSSAVASTAGKKSNEVIDPVHVENNKPTRTMLAPHHARVSSAGPTKPTAADSSSSLSQDVVKETTSMKTAMDGWKKKVVVAEAEKTKLKTELDFTKKQLTDARTGPMSNGPNGSIHGRSGGNQHQNHEQRCNQYGTSSSNSSSNRERKILGALKSIGIDTRACNDCGMDVSIQFRGITEGRDCQFLALKCLCCEAEMARWDI